jgi:hypothetical protein
MSGELEKLIRIIYKKWKAGIAPAQGSHPEEDDLASFVEKKLSAQDAARIKNHVLACARCAEVLSVSLKLNKMPEIALPEGLLEASLDSISGEIPGPRLEIFLQVKGKILEIINTTGDVLLGQELLPAAVLRSRKIRDFRDEIIILKDFGNIQVEAKIETKTSGNFNLQVAIKEKKTQAFIKDLRVTLIKGDVELESYLAESGKAFFEHIHLGRYAVRIYSLTGKVAEILIDMKV